MSNNNVTPKKRGRPATGKNPHISARFPENLIEAVDAYADVKGLSRSQAIRKIVEDALASAAKH